MYRAFLRTYPSELAFKSEALPETAEVADYLVIFRADDQVLQRANCSHYNFVAAPERERHAVAFDTVARVRRQYYVRRGIIGVGVHGVGAVERSGSWCSDISDSEPGDGARHDRFLCAAW